MRQRFIGAWLLLLPAVACSLTLNVNKLSDGCPEGQVDCEGECKISCSTASGGSSGSSGSASGGGAGEGASGGKVNGSGGTPMDAGDQANGKVVSKKWLKEVREMQLAVAKANGCAVWDMYQAMGGEQSVARWVTAKLMNKDLDTFTTIAKEMHVPVSFANVAQRYQQTALAAGIGEKDTSDIYTLIERLAALK